MRTSATNADRFEGLVEAWQGPIYRLALRMLGDDAAAQDVTQEVFVRLLDGLDRYDRRRDFRPWIYRIARNVVLNRVRAEDTRRRHEALAAAERGTAHEDNAVERTERDALVAGHVRRLPPDERLPLVLHFYEGLSQVEVAEVLETARTTVRSRIERALGSLRASLQGAGHLSLVPAVEAVMRSSAAPAVPAKLSVSLLDLAARAGTVALPSTTAGLVLGGILVTKKATIAAVVITALSLAAGYLAGSSGTARAPERAARGGEAEAGLRAELDTLRTRNEELAARVAQLESERNADGAGGGGSQEGGQVDAPALVGAAPASATGIDWSRFAKQFAEHAELIASMRGGEMSDFDPKQQQAAMKVYTEYMRVASDAHALADVPFFDERILPEFVDAIYGEALGLTAEQRDELQAVARAALRQHAGPAGGESLPSLEAYAARIAVIDGITAHLEGAAGPDKAERLRTVHSIGREMLRGDREVRTLGLDTDSDVESRVDGVLETWRRSYALPETLPPAAHDAARAFVQGAADALARRGLNRPDLDPDGPEFEEVDREFLRLQIEAERALRRSLPDRGPEGGEDAPPTMPRAIRFRPGADDMTVVTSGGGM